MISKFLEWASRNGAFSLTFYALTASLILAFGKNADATTLLPTLLGLYLGQHGATKISAHFAASKDPSCDTAKVISTLNGNPPEDDTEKTNL